MTYGKNLWKSTCAGSKLIQSNASHCLHLPFSSHIPDRQKLRLLVKRSCKHSGRTLVPLMYGSQDFAGLEPCKLANETRSGDKIGSDKNEAGQLTSCKLMTISNRLRF